MDNILLNTFKKLGLNVDKFKNENIFREFIECSKMFTISVWKKTLSNRSR